MSSPIHLKRSGPLAAMLAVLFACFAGPAAAQTPVNLGTSGSFVVLGGQTVTNTGPSVLNGDLGVSPGTALVGFGLPAVVNGATHANDGVASQAQLDLTTAYNVAAGEPVAPGDVLTGIDLGGLTLVPGSYRHDTSAQLTGQLTLDAGGDPNAQFVFQIGTTLTTASASSVLLVNGASPCNVYWQIGSSATLGTGTAFQGNLMALTSISLNSGATVLGRALARNGAVTLNNNTLNAAGCGANTTPTPTPTPTPGGGTTPGTGTSPGTGGTGPGAGNGTGNGPTRAGRATRNGRATVRRGSRSSCTDGFRATVRGRMIARVVFRLDGRRVKAATRSPFRVALNAGPGRHRLTARVTFRDATRAKTVALRYRACAAQLLQPRQGPSRFTG